MKKVYLPAALLLFAASALMLLRMTVGAVGLENMKPTIMYYLTMHMEATLHGEPATIKAFLPKTDAHQAVVTEKVESSRLAYTLTSVPPNRRAEWRAEGVEGHEVATYEAVVRVQPLKYVLPQGVPVPRDYSPGLSEFLQPTEAIQSTAPEIRATVERLLPKGSESADVARTTRVLFDFVHEWIRASSYENTLDALTTLKWGEAFCGGKSRLLVALLRASNIPARVVGGLILTPGSKRTTHAWVEAWINGVWVPFDALNDHFAEHPGNYLVFYYGDEVLFSRTSDINFQYRFDLQKWRTAPDESLSATSATLLNPYLFWDAFRKAHISLNLLRIILLLPVGVLLVVVLRNVVGVTTYGTFHPALIAVAFRDTGLLWGIALYVSLLLLGGLVRRVLDRYQLLHTPRVAILLVFVVSFLLAVTYASVRAGALEPAHISFFPIAILALTVENFFLTAVEHGRSQAAAVLAQTLAVITLVYVTIDSFFVQAVVFVFPEVLLGIIAASLVVGRWTGMRLTEYRRFRLLLAE